MHSLNTLKDLKANAHKYEWKLLSNSFYSSIPSHQDCYRKVGSAKSTRFSLLTNLDGQVKESWVDFPKAKELKITHFGLDFYRLEITRDLEDSVNNPHVMVYELKPIYEVFKN